MPQVKRLSRRSHGILRPALGLAGHTAHLGNEPGRDEAAFQIGVSWELQHITHLEDLVTIDISHVLEAF